MANFNPIDSDYIVRWQSDIENTKERPHHKPLQDQSYRIGRSLKFCETVHCIEPFSPTSTQLWKSVASKKRLALNWNVYGIHAVNYLKRLNQINTFAVYVIIFVVHAALRESHHMPQSMISLWWFAYASVLFDEFFPTFFRGQMKSNHIKISILYNVSLFTPVIDRLFNAI